MPNKKRTLSLEDYEACYQYFRRAIQSNRFMEGGKHDTVRTEAIAAFTHIESSPQNAECVQLFQLWLDDFIDASIWSRCYRALNQKKYLLENGQHTITISDRAYNVLKDLANRKNTSLSKLIIDGCALINSGEEIFSEPTKNVLKTTNLIPLNINSTKYGQAKKPEPSVVTDSINVISLFDEKLPEPLDELFELDPAFGSIFFDEPPEWPRKPEGYDFRKNESYKKYRKRIDSLTIKKPDEELLSYFDKTINYYLTENNCHQIGSHLLSIRKELLERNLLTTEFNPDFFAISKGFNAPNLSMDDYADELLYLLGYIFGCTTETITAGNRQPLVFVGHPNHIQLAHKTYNYRVLGSNGTVNRLKDY